MKLLTSAALVLLPALAASWPVQADIYTCRTPSGETTVSDTLCERGTRLEQISPAESVSSPEKARADLERQKAWANQRSAERSSGGDGPHGSVIPYQPTQLSPYTPPRQAPVVTPVVTP